MQKLSIAISLILSIQFYTYSNPVSPYQYPLITDVQWISSTNWSIELRNSMVRKVAPSACTTSALKLYIVSSQKICSTHVYFDSTGLGVITPASIIPKTSTEPPLTIKNTETVYIPDPENTNVKYPNYGWSCALNSIGSGLSLINAGTNSFVKSIRSSIGSVGNYTTRITLLVVDRDWQVVSGLPAYYKTSKAFNMTIPNYTSFYYHNSGITDTNGIITLSATIGQNNFLMFSDSVPNYYSETTYPVMENKYVRHDPVCEVWACKYNDSLLECKDTLMIKPNYHKVTISDKYGNPVTDITPKFYQLPIGAKIKEGVFLLRLFQNTSTYPIEIYLKDNKTVVAACTLNYVNTRDTLNKNLVAVSTLVQKQRLVSNTISNTIQSSFSVIGNNYDNIAFIISIYQTVSDLSIKITSLDGKCITKFNLPVNAPGTHTIKWNMMESNRKSLAPGKYRCILSSNGTVLSTQSLSVVQ